MARVVGARRHLVGQQGAVRLHEELHAQHPGVVQGLDEGTGMPAGAPLQILPVQGGGSGGRHGRGGHDGDRQDAVAVEVPVHRQGHHGAVPASGDDDADLGREVDAPLQHAGPTAQRVPGGGQVGGGAHSHLPLAVVAQAGGFQHARKQRRIRRRRLGLGFDARVGHAGHARGQETGLLSRAVLAHRHRLGRRRHTHRASQPLQHLGRHVLELGGDGVALAGHRLQRLRVVEGGAQVHVRGCAGGADDVGIKHQGAETHGLCRVHEHPTQLPASEHTQRGDAPVGPARPGKQWRSGLH